MNLMEYAMKYKLYKMKFTSPVHFGEGHLDSSAYTFMADRLFSALYIEALKYGSADKLYAAANNGYLLISDGLPYIVDNLYIPKPVIRVNSGSESNSVIKKAFKKLSYIPIDKIDEYLNGSLDPGAENKAMDQLGRYADTTRAAVRSGTEDTLPYRVGTYSFCNGSGLYIIVGAADDEVSVMMDGLVRSLGYTGIGGKVSSGLGKFSVSAENIPAELLERFIGRYDRYITLAVSMAKNDCLEAALNNAGYMLVRRGGFVGSQKYSDSWRKKREMYCFAAGSCFENRFEGCISDLSDGGTHPVYRYAMPLFMGVMLP